MTTPASDVLRETAQLWVLRAADADFDDWDGLTRWLESEPANLAAYDAAVDDDRWATELFAAQPARPVLPAFDPPAPRARRGFGGLRRNAVAATAVLAATIGGWALLDRGGAEVIATAPGEHRTIVLADGSRVAMNGATRVGIDPDRPREIALVQGEALFDVRHDARNLFVVTTGGTRLVDAGTVFNVVARGGALDVAVAEGAVIVDDTAGSRGARAVRLNAGDALSRASASTRPVVRKTAPQTIGTWRTGYLSYVDAPLSIVADDLSRNTGRAIRVSAGAGTIRFSGTVMLGGDVDAVLARTGPLLGVRFVAGAEGWTMMPADGARR